MSLAVEVAPQKQPKAMLHQHCHFPTAVRWDMNKFRYRTIGIFDREDTITGWEHDRQSLRDLVLNAWAVLLRYYVRNDIVTFLTLADSLGHHDIGSTKSESCYGEDTEAMVLQYQLLGNLLLQDIRTSESTKCTDHEVGDARINTVVRFSSLCPKSLLPGNEVHWVSTRTEDAVIMDNVRYRVPSGFHIQD